MFRDGRYEISVLSSAWRSGESWPWWLSQIAQGCKHHGWEGHCALVNDPVMLSSSFFQSQWNKYTQAVNFPHRRKGFRKWPVCMHVYIEDLYRHFDFLYLLSTWLYNRLVPGSAKDCEQGILRGTSWERIKVLSDFELFPCNSYQLPWVTECKVFCASLRSVLNVCWWGNYKVFRNWCVTHRYQHGGEGFFNFWWVGFCCCVFCFGFGFEAGFSLAVLERSL